ncbi:hypothetical protein GCM10010282_37710 [Streptomyces roseolus]|nr:hypothetical protein GCM10010282_37710 [Streptomyces roseolus]
MRGFSWRGGRAEGEQRGVVVEAVSEVLQEAGEGVGEGLGRVAGVRGGEGEQRFVPEKAGAVRAGAGLGEPVGVEEGVSPGPVVVAVVKGAERCVPAGRRTRGQ